MPLYFMPIPCDRFDRQIRPALATSWRQGSFDPCREICKELLVPSVSSRLWVSSEETMLAAVLRGVPFDRWTWRSLVGEVLLFCAADLPEILIDPAILVEIEDDAVITFPNGIPGFPEHTGFVLIDDERFRPFDWLQSVTDPFVGFVAVEPALVAPDYEFDLSDEDADLLELDRETEPLVLTIVTVPEDFRASTANLKAPLVINPRRRLGKQIILSDERYPLRSPIFSWLRCR